MLVAAVSVCQAVFSRAAAPTESAAAFPAPGYLEYSSENCLIRYTLPDAGYVPTISRMVDLYFPLLENDFGLSQDARTVPVILICPDAAAFQDGMDKSGKFPIGAYRDGVVYIASPSLWLQDADGSQAKDVFMTKGPLIHELAHFLTGVKTGGRCAVWVDEGVALYYEYKYTGQEWRPDLAGNTGLSLGDLEDNWDNLDPDMAYRKAFETILSIVDAHGEAALQGAL